MFSSALRDYRQAASEIRQEIDKSKKDANNAVDELTETLLTDVNKDVSAVYQNQQRLEQEAKALQTQTSRFVKQTNKWLAMYKSLNDSLKELGDVKNWAETIEADMKAVADTLQRVAAQSQSSSASGQGPSEKKQSA